MSPDPRTKLLQSILLFGIEQGPIFSYGALVSLPGKLTWLETSVCWADLGCCLFNKLFGWFINFLPFLLQQSKLTSLHIPIMEPSLLFNELMF